MKTIKYYLTSFMLLVVHIIVAQPDTSLVNSTHHLGAAWGSNGGYTTFGMAGQYMQGTLSGGDYTGKIGYVIGNISSEPPVNQPPVASAPTQRFFYELGEILTLDGSDPENQPIEFEITAQPTYGEITVADGVNTQEVKFTPNAGLLPGTTFQDQFTFQVNEVNDVLSSDPATVLFKFQLEDTEHEVVGLSKSNNTFTVTIADEVFNASYGIEVNYYDISDPLNASFINIKNESVLQSELTIGSGSATYSFDVDQTAHSYLFNTDQVLVTVLATTPNSYSSFNSFIIDNLAGGRVLASEDGEYFAVGSDLTVPENKSAKVKLIAVDFAGFDAEPTIEWTKNPTQGVLGGFSLKESSEYLRVWESTYTSTKDVGAEDDFSFRVFNSIRNSYESATINMSVLDVNDVPKLSAIPNQQLEEDGSKTVSLTYSDPDNDLNVFASSNNESLLTASIVDGQLSIQTVEGKSGTTTVNVWVEESAGDDPQLVLKQLSVTVTPVNDAPVLAAISDQSGDEDVTIQVPLVATDVDGDVILFSYVASIDDPTIASVNVSANTLNIVPKANVNGSAQISVTADDGSGASNALSNTVTFNVTFNAVNDDPEVVSELVDQVLLESFTNFDIDFSAYFSDAETAAGSLTYSHNSGGSVVSITGLGPAASTATISYVGTGTETITFTASDGGGGTDASFDVVFTVNASPIELAVANEVTVAAQDEDFGTLDIDISNVFSDSRDANAIFTYDVLGATLVETSIDGQTLTLTSKSNKNGSEDLVLVGSISGESVIEIFTVTINAVNDAPVISAVATQTVKEDATLENVLVEIVDPEDDAISVFTVTSGNQTLIADGSISNTNSGNFYFLDLSPEANQNGSTTITITAGDGIDDPTVTTFTLNVSAVNDLPTVAGSLSNLDQDGSFNTDITTLFADIDSETLTYEVESKPDWMTQTDNTLSGTPSNDDVGIDQVTILASDQGGSIRATFEFEIINVNDAPEVVQTAGSRIVYTGEAFSYDFPEGNFKDIDVGDNLVYTIESKPSWLTDDGSGTVSGTPTISDVGQSEVVYRATDGSGLFVEDMLTINVSELTYDVTVSFTNKTRCTGGISSVTASGAFAYKWYGDADGNNLLQDGGTTYKSSEPVSVYAEGIDAQGNATATKFEASIDFNPLPDATLTKEGDVLKVPAGSGYTYTWTVDDTNISEATGATYEATKSGSYQVVVVTDLGCSSTSNALDVTIVIPEEPEEVLGLDDEIKQVAVYPVPAHDYLTLKLPEMWRNAQLSVVNLQGQEMLFKSQLMSDEIKIDLQSYQNGIYFVRLQMEGQQLNLKFIKE